MLVLLVHEKAVLALDTGTGTGKGARKELRAPGGRRLHDDKGVTRRLLLVDGRALKANGRGESKRRRAEEVMGRFDGAGSRRGGRHCQGSRPKVTCKAGGR